VLTHSVERTLEDEVKMEALDAALLLREARRVYAVLQDPRCLRAQDIAPYRASVLSYPKRRRTSRLANLCACSCSSSRAASRRRRTLSDEPRGERVWRFVDDEPLKA
jgi:hypothetical protein